MSEPNEPGSRSGFLRRYRLMLLLVAVVLVVAAAAGVSWQGQQSQLAEQRARIHTLGTQAHTTKARQQARTDRDVLDALGVSRKRLTSDSLVIDQLVSLVFTWNSGQSYAAARSKVIDRFDLESKSSFLTSFMPPARFNTDDAGRRYDYIDTAELNCSVEDDPDIEVVRVRGGDYSYAVTADVTVTGDDTATTEAGSSRRMLLLLTIDSDGAITHLSGVPPDGSTRSSE